MSYKWEGMRKISYEEALELYRDKLIFLLYDDDTEGALDNGTKEDLRRINEHNEYGGEFGYEI